MLIMSQLAKRQPNRSSVICNEANFPLLQTDFDWLQFHKDFGFIHWLHLDSKFSRRTKVHRSIVQWSTYFWKKGQSRAITTTSSCTFQLFIYDKIKHPEAVEVLYLIFILCRVFCSLTWVLQLKQYVLISSEVPKFQNNVWFLVLHVVLLWLSVHVRQS